ncbi:alpha amylase N-terminal ig-like domain-containing protein [bacterium]|nr:alpha amylase N-terminal ig-like domain-containing protein [bacterium]
MRAAKWVLTGFLAAGLGICGGTALAGPVPGVEDFDRSPVEFPYPEHMEVWDIGNDEYLVTFTWKPEEPVKDPAVAGTFNGWNRTDLPMEGPDADGVYRVTARIPGGDHKYKLVGNDDGWYRDTANPNFEPGIDNSILLLGLPALLQGRTAEIGDGEIETRAFLHRPDEAMYFDVFSPTEVTIRFRTLVGDVEGVDLNEIARDGSVTPQPMTRVAHDEMFDFWEKTVRLGDDTTNILIGLAVEKKELNEGPVAYSFTAHDGYASETTEGRPYSLIIDPSRIPQTPAWVKDAIWYQIMVERFRNGDPSNDPKPTHPWTSEWYKLQPYEKQVADETGRTFWDWIVFDRMYGGDFQGVKDELDYLQDLGVTAIYFNPVFESQGHHKYNARTYVYASDDYGVQGEFEKSMETHDAFDPSTWGMNKSDQMLVDLIAEIHKRDMRVIFDGVFNHLGDDSPYFLDLKENGKDSKFAPWYDVISYEPFDYRGWAGFKGLPEFKKSETGLESESLTKFIYDVTERWMDPNGDGDPSDGIDGWRLDVPGELPAEFWVHWRDHVKSINPDAYIVGEEWNPRPDMLDGKKFDAVMNYPFAKAVLKWVANKQRKITPTELDNELALLRITYPREITYVLQNLYDSHDTDRIVSQIANSDRDFDVDNRVQDGAENYDETRPNSEDYARLRLMAVLQNTYMGSPMIWYGTEVGMYGADDPNCRQPMWWQDLMPYDDPSNRIDNNLRAFYRELFEMRNDHPELRTGEYLTLLTNDEADSFAFLRWAPGSKNAFVTLLNNSSEEQTLQIPAPTADALPNGFVNPKIIFGEATTAAGEFGDSLTVAVPPITGVVVQVQR